MVHNLVIGIKYTSIVILYPLPGSMAGFNFVKTIK